MNGQQTPKSKGRGRISSVQSDSALLDEGFIRRVKSEVNLFRAKSLNLKGKLGVFRGFIAFFHIRAWPILTRLKGCGNTCPVDLNRIRFNIQTPKFGYLLLRYSQDKPSWQINTKF